MKSIHAESKGAAHCWAETPEATTAFMSRAPSMCREAAAARHVGDGADLVQRPDGAAAQVGRLLDPGEAAPRHVAVVGTDGGLERRRVVLPARAVEALHVDAGQRCGAAGFEMDRVRRLVRQHLLAVAAVDAERDLVAHGARRQKERRLLAEEVGDHLLEEIDRRVLVLLLVAHVRVAHEAAHLQRGLGQRIAVEIDLDRHRAVFYWSGEKAEGITILVACVMSVPAPPGGGHSPSARAFSRVALRASRVG